MDVLSFVGSVENLPQQLDEFEMSMEFVGKMVQEKNTRVLLLPVLDRKVPVWLTDKQDDLDWLKLKLTEKHEEKILVFVPASQKLFRYLYQLKYSSKNNYLG